MARSIYSVPGDLVGQSLSARADRTSVKLCCHGQLIKVHPRQAPGQRSSDPADLPTERSAYAMRDVSHLIATAAHLGEAIGDYARALLEGPLPWTKMRQVFRLHSLVNKWGAQRVNSACEKALEAEAINVNLVSRMIERARENLEPDTAPAPNVVQGRFWRDPSEFTSSREAQ